MKNILFTLALLVSMTTFSQDLPRWHNADPEDIKAGKYEDRDEPNPKRIPVTPESNILAFLAECSPHLEDWERELLYFALEDAQYFMPQIRTKIMNEGWACMIHEKIVNALGIPDDYYLSFIRLHNQVVRPHMGRINPYHLGFKIFKYICKFSLYQTPNAVKLWLYKYWFSIVYWFITNRVC